MNFTVTVTLQSGFVFDPQGGERLLLWYFAHGTGVGDTSGSTYRINVALAIVVTGDFTGQSQYLLKEIFAEVIRAAASG